MVNRTMVVGGGLLGGMMAHLLARQGVPVAVYDLKRPGNATWAGAGIISPEISAVVDPDYVELAMAAGRYYPELVERLNDYDIGYGQAGIAKVRMRGEDPTAFERAKTAIFRRQAEGRFPTQHAVQEVNPDWLREQHPLLGDVAEALYYPQAARVDGRKLASALRMDSERHGAQWIDAEVQGLQVKEGRIRGVTTDRGDADADQVVMAAGFWSRSLLEPVGLHLGLTPHRGQIVHLATDRRDAGEWPIIEGMHGHYLLAWPDGRVVAGATRETGTGDAPHLTAEGQHEVLTQAFRVAPGLKPAMVVEWRVGLRPASEDGRPILGAVPPVEGLFVVTGHGAGGLLCGPYSAELVVRHMLEGRPINPAFSAARFL